jgi:hypothetical protein
MGWALVRTKTARFGCALLALILLASWPFEAWASSQVQTLSDPGRDAVEPQVAVDADGDAVVVWRRFFGTSWRVQARAQARSGSLRVVNTLSDPDAAGPFSELAPRVSIDRDGDAVVVWARSDGTNSRVEAAEMSAI